MEAVRYYKVLNINGTPYHGGTGRWNLPDGSEPGAWMPRVYSLVPCERGYHLCRNTRDLLSRLGPAIYLAEIDGAVIACADEVVAETARLLRKLSWDQQTARLFAADCAEHVLLIFERAMPGDLRPRTAIEVARRYANGDASDIELASTRDAAYAAGAAVRDAAKAAVSPIRDAYAAGAAAADAAAGATTEAAAKAAAGNAAWAAAWAAVGNGAEDDVRAAIAAERGWQAQRLDHYLELEVGEDTVG